MRTEYEIYMDFRKANEQVRLLRAIANRMNSLANEDLDKTLGSIRSDWTGDNAEKFDKKGKTVKGKINATAGTIITIANTIESIARRTYDTEIEAIRIAGTKNR